MFMASDEQVFLASGELEIDGGETAKYRLRSAEPLPGMSGAGAARFHAC